MLDSNTLTYAPFTDPRRSRNSAFDVGQSGRLLVGTENSGKKYIIKHCYPHNAANEYVACWLAKKLGVPAPDAYLLTPNKAFDSKYAVAIELLNLEPFDKTAAPHPEDLISQFALSSLIAQDDTIQLNVAEGHIVSYDFSEAFCMDNMNGLLALLATGSERDNDTAIEIIRRHVTSFRRHLSFMDFDVPGLAREFNLNNQQMREGMIAVGKKVLQITEENVYALSEELENLYPFEIAIFYEECIFSIQRHMKKF